jgi:hypothetical protein
MSHFANIARGNEVAIAIGKGEVMLGVEQEYLFHDAKIRKK